MDISIFTPVFEDFEELLKRRFRDTGIIYTTSEDSIRYAFFHALTRRLSIEPHEIFLEYPIRDNDSNHGQEVDTFFRLDDSAVAIEFKHHRVYKRRAGSKSTFQQNERAGELFKDMCRLCRLDDGGPLERLVVFCAAPEMVNYLLKRRNKYQGFFELRKGQSYTVNEDFYNQRQKTFMKKCEQPESFDLQLCWEAELHHGYELRIYVVHPLAS